MTHPLYDAPRQVTPYAAVVLADNPSVMTLDGTNTWVLRAPGSSTSVVLDPGPDDAAHLDAVKAAAGDVELTLISHWHGDHTDGSAAFQTLSGAPARALDPEWCRDGKPLEAGEIIEAAGLRIEVLHTPGHTSDSLSFVIDDADRPAVLTADTILGKGTTVVAHPDGVLADYLESLRTLEKYADHVALPGHGPELDSTGKAAAFYLEHREQRLAQVRGALATLGDDATARQVVEVVYVDVPQENWPAAELSVEAQLLYLRSS